MRHVLRLAATCWIVAITIPAFAQHGAVDGEWRHHSGDLGATKYSPLDQITADNFGDLDIAWHWTTVDTHHHFRPPAPSRDPRKR